MVLAKGGDALQQEGNRRSGIALAMRHRLYSDLSTYELTANEREMSTLLSSTLEHSPPYL